jgi:RES domain-containing protein
MSLINAYRMCRERYDPRDATGAERFGGRWNLPGIPLLYAASTISLACLEILVHVRNPELFPDDFTYTPIEFPDEVCSHWPPEGVDAKLKTDALASEVISRNVGSDFQRLGKNDPSKASVVQEVPSVVVPQEMNYLVNPEHPEYARVVWGKTQPFRFDKRLLFVGLR